MILRCAGKDATEDFDSVHAPELLSEALPESTVQGHIDPAELQVLDPKLNDTMQTKSDSNAPPSLHSLINLHDFEHVAGR